MANEYEDIDRWNGEQKTLLQQQQEKQEDVVNRQTQMTVDEINRQKEKLDKDTTKTTRGLYTDYQKQANPYGVQAERQASLGLGNSGYSETAKTNLYNNYQKSVTETLNNANTLKANFDNEIARARQQGSITIAQNALELYKQQMQLLTQEYEMRNNRKQFLYQQDRDRISDNQWQQQYDMQRNQWQQQFDYQKERDAVSDNQWQQQYELSKKASTRSSSSRSSSSKKKSNGTTVNVNDSGNQRPSKEEIVKNIRVVQAPGNQGAVVDGLTNKKYSSLESLLNSYGYATARD
jgi:hypothetical protein